MVNDGFWNQKAFLLPKAITSEEDDEDNDDDENADDDDVEGDGIDVFWKQNTLMHL